MSVTKRDAQGAVADQPLVLASASPRRKDLLSQVGIPIEVIPSDVDESAIRDPDPLILSRKLAVSKATAIRDAIPDGRSRWILGADTVVVIDNEVLEKPTDAADARAMLHRLSGRTHDVITGIALLIPGTPEPATGASDTAVTFAPMSDAEIDWYISTGEWRDVAGGYRIQGACARFIPSISGSYSNVVGLPLDLVYSILCAYNWLPGNQHIPPTL